jgi:hypothetical protein
METAVYRDAALVASFVARSGREFAIFYGAAGAELRALVERRPAGGMAYAGAGAWAARLARPQLEAAGYRLVRRDAPGD